MYLGGQVKKNSEGKSGGVYEKYNRQNNEIIRIRRGYNILEIIRKI